MGVLNSKEALDLNLGYYVLGSKPNLIRSLTDQFELLDSNQKTISTQFEVDDSDPVLSELRLSYGSQLKRVGIDQLQNFTNLAMCSRHLVYLSPNIALLRSSLLCIQMCCNQLTKVPIEIGYCNQLTVLDLSKNRLTSLPETIGLLNKLVELKLNYNFLKQLPNSIGLLTKLTVLLVAHNKLISLPREMGNLQKLQALDCSFNPMTTLPAEVGRLPLLRRLRLEGCPLKTEMEIENEQKLILGEVGNKMVLSLKELAARTVMLVQVDTQLDTLPQPIVSYLQSVQRCSFCQGPYFQTSYPRSRVIEKNELKIPLQYQLCSPHWNSEVERVSLLFCTTELKPNHLRDRNLNLLSRTVPYLTPPEDKVYKVRQKDPTNGMGSFGLSATQLKSLLKFKPQLRKSNSNSTIFTNNLNSSSLSEAIDRTPRLPNLPSHLSLPRRSFSNSLNSTNSSTRRSLSLYVP